jgi:hypothetical protein
VRHCVCRVLVIDRPFGIALGVPRCDDDLVRPETASLHTIDAKVTTSSFVVNSVPWIPIHVTVRVGFDAKHVVAAQPPDVPSPFRIDLYLFRDGTPSERGILRIWILDGTTIRCDSWFELVFAGLVAVRAERGHVGQGGGHGGGFAHAMIGDRDRDERETHPRRGRRDC